MARKTQPLQPRPYRVLICPDKFKGTLTATQAAEAIAAGWRRSRPGDALDLLPISDGGDGFGELLGRHLGAEPQVCDTVDAAHRPVRATWWWVPDRRLALVESARVIGLAMLPPARFHPFELDTYGLGILLQAIRAHRPSWTIIGLGGSATNDAGFGMARALGWRFLDGKGDEITRWPGLMRLKQVLGFSLPRFHGEIEIAVDVRNPLLGRRGASRVYGPQKGLRPEDMRPAEQAFERLVEVLKGQERMEGHDARQPGAGAAGGLGFGLAAFIGGPLVNGFETLASMTQFTERLWKSDLVITGEGAIDETTVRMGKGVGQVARAARRARRPCLGLGGVVRLDARLARRFTKVAAMTPDLAPPEAAQREAARWLETLASRVAASWSP